MVMGIAIIAVEAGTVLVVAVVGGILVFVVTKTTMARFGCMAPPSTTTIVKEDAHHEGDCTVHGALHITRHKNIVVPEPYCCLLMSACVSEDVGSQKLQHGHYFALDDEIKY